MRKSDLTGFTFRFQLLLIVMFVVLSFVLPVFLGVIPLDPDALFGSSLERKIVWLLRMPRIMFAFLVGFSLSMIGVVFQALLRNDLATPYTLGVSSGGALGAVLAIKTGLIVSIAGFPSIVFFSVLGSMLTILIIYLLARSGSVLSPLSLILTGITISLIFSALILFIHYLADFTETYRMIRWLMGGLQISGWSYVLTVLPFAAAAAVYFFHHANAMNIMSAGHEIALSKGVEVRKLQKGSFFGGSMLVGVVVALAGPIGFVGLIIPHLIRLIVGPDHKKLLPAAALFGGAFLIWCDTLARLIIAPAELPVGVITAILGGPFFIWLLIRHKRG